MKRNNPVASSSKAPLLIAEQNKEIQPDQSTEGTRLDDPPVFHPLFPELSEEDQCMAIQYISYADETERSARILHVCQSIEESPKVLDVC